MEVATLNCRFQNLRTWTIVTHCPKLVMCLVFLSVGRKVQEKGYRLVLASNRDEFYMRKTAVCSWRSATNPTNGSVIPVEPNGTYEMICGIDLQEGKEGGTWLSMSQEGKIGILLNVLQGERKVEDRSCASGGRGFLVIDYLKDKRSDEEYLSELQAKKDEYQPFHLLTLNLRETDTPVYHYCNVPDFSPTVLNSDVIAMGNHLPRKSWRKVEAGKAAFQKIITEPHGKESLTEKLFQLLSDSKMHFPDSELEAQAKSLDTSIIQAISAVFVKADSIKYGTRTQTVILVDLDNKVTFVERTIDCTSKFSSINDAKTDTIQFEFELAN